jgi:UDP-N-acetylmuramyl pentapeptide phosphotransferase/UDP-N-acetylglucosamine-1-phosphate transferase
LALLWIVGCINAFNFMDGIDGLAGGQGVVLGLAWLAVGLLMPWPSLQLLGLLLASSSTGFLLHNWAPARIFMGDSGSAFLGYWAAVAPFCTPRPGHLLVPAALIIWPLLFDSGLTLLRRVHAGESLLVAHRGHLYQRLVDRGAGQARVAAAYVVLAACGAAAATLSVLEQHPYAVGAVLALPLVAGLLLAALPRPQHADSTR